MTIIEIEGKTYKTDGTFISLKNENQGIALHIGQLSQKIQDKIQDEIFEQEKAQALAEDCRLGICECCPGSAYYGI